MKHLTWHKSSYSSDGGNCVEIADLANGARIVRDSKYPASGVLVILPAAWAAFTAGVRSGEFD